MTVLAELNAITLTGTAKSAVSAKGADIGALHQQAKLATAELQKILRQIISHHPTGGGDAANSAAFTTILNETL